MLGQDPNKNKGFGKERKEENQQKERGATDFKPGTSRVYRSKI